MFRKISKSLQFVTTLGIIITGVTLVGLTSGHAELVNCACFMQGTEAGDPDVCETIPTTQKNAEDCRLACITLTEKEKTTYVTYSYGPKAGNCVEPASKLYKPSTK